MKVTQLGHAIPVGGLTGLSGGGGELSGTNPATGGYPPSGQVPVATGSNTWAWASNLQTAWANGSNQILGPHINFISGTNITLSVSSNSLTIAAAGGSGSLIVKDEGSTLVTAASSLNFVGSGVSATNSGNDVTVTISGGSSSDPTIPSGGTLYDGSSTSGWTTFGSPDTFDVSTISGAFYLQETTFGTNNLIGVYRSTSSFPRTYTMKILDGFMHANFHGICMLFGEAAPGKFWSWGAVRDGGNVYSQRYAWTTASSSGASVNYTATQDMQAVPPKWYRIVVNSSTDVELWHSYNGYIYYRHAAAQNPAFTIGVFGFGFYTFAAIEHKMAIDWIHES